MKADDAEKILKLIADSLEQGRDFVVAQAPDVVQEIVTWNRWSNTVGAVTCLVLALIAARLFYKFYKLAKLTSDPNDDWNGGAIFSAIGTVAMAVAVPILTYQAAFWWVAPKYALLEMATKLLH